MRLNSLFTGHWLLAFAVMGMAALAFGIVSFNLFFLLNANLAFIADNGSLALEEGALMQLLELLGYGIVAMMLYLVFKACEKSLVDRMLE